MECSYTTFYEGKPPSSMKGLNVSTGLKCRFEKMEQVVLNLSNVVLKMTKHVIEEKGLSGRLTRCRRKFFAEYDQFVVGRSLLQTGVPKENPPNEGARARAYVVVENPQKKNMSPTEDDLDLLKKEKLYAKFSKSWKFMLQEVQSLLGTVWLTVNGIHVDSSKVISKFLQDLKPLTPVDLKRISLMCGAIKQDEAFQILKEETMQCPV
ncbi:hypothetical protein Tco_1326881 [Tanacetum coccineum]